MTRINYIIQNAIKYNNKYNNNFNNYTYLLVCVNLFRNFRRNIL